jgi:hypothetical protein
VTKSRRERQTGSNRGEMGKEFKSLIGEFQGERQLRGA